MQRRSGLLCRALLKTRLSAIRSIRVLNVACCAATSSSGAGGVAARSAPPAGLLPVTRILAKAASQSVPLRGAKFASMSPQEGGPFHLDDVAAQVRTQDEATTQAYELGRRIHVALRKLQRRQGASRVAAATTSTTTATFAEDHTGASNQPSSTSQLAAELEDLIGQVSSITGPVAPFHIGASTSLAATDAAAAPPSSIHPRTPRLANLSGRVEEYVRHLLFRHFLESDGRLLPMSALALAVPSVPRPPLHHVTDEEYLLACMGLTHDLHRHGLSRATLLDRGGVESAAQLVSQLYEFFVGLDFRNGPLRRRYDSTKYALKGLESILYELAVVANVGTQNRDESKTHDHGTAARTAKRPRTAVESTNDVSHTTWPLLPSEELKELQDRMVHRDELRETLIKQCRDGQKAAKQAIFALQRGDVKRALQLLEECRACIATRLVPAAREEPPLRNSGSLSGVMEEYAEAKLFAAWLYGPDEPSPDNTTTTPPSRPDGTLLKLHDFDVDLSLEEYLGGLCDLTGEIGRYAVLRGTARDVDGVRFCLDTVSDIYYALETIERLPQGLGKKMEPLRNGIEKMERMLYELRLSEAAGRKVRSDVAVQPEPLTHIEDA